MGAKRVVLVGGFLIMALSVLRCDDSSAPTNVTISDPQAQQAGNAVASQIASLPDAFTLDSFTDLPFEKAARAIPANSPLRHILLASRWFQYGITADSCASFSDTTDTDGDGVPNDLIVRFDQAGCTQAEESLTVQLSGSFRVTDPSATNPGFNIAYSNVLVHIASLNGDYLDFLLNGTQGVTATTTTAALHDNTSFVIGAGANGRTATASVGQNWNANFAAATGHSVDPGLPLPDGALTLTGSSTYASGRDNFAFTVSTEAPLQYQAACLAYPNFDSGELHALVSGNQGGAFVRIRFVGCGQDPIVTLVGRPAL